jgi:membrane-bound lytic murein transglycosylase F
VRAGDRHDPRASIFGGAKYLALLRRTIPRRIQEPDRTWLAVAAYNVGIGHLEDARILAQAQGRNPDSWDEVRQFLPLLSPERWYTQTKRGYARGWEPVRYVDNVQSYLNILQVAGMSVNAKVTAPPDPVVAPPSQP